MLVLLRHGQSAGNAEGRLLGRLESPLSPAGRAQAEAWRGRLGDVVRLVSSPLGRARETAQALGLGLDVEIDERWVELDYGELDGVRLAEVPAALWACWRDDPAFRPPGGETLVELGVRVGRACDELLGSPPGRAPDRHVVVVSHVSPIKAAVAWALGVGAEVAWRLHLQTGSLTTIAWGAAGPSLVRFDQLPEGAP